MNNHTQTNINPNSLAGKLVAGVALLNAGVAQTVARLASNEKVAGSTPATRSIFNTIPSCPLSRFAGAFLFLVMGLLAGLLIIARFFL